jgi:hypothetical protein
MFAKLQEKSQKIGLGGGAQSILFDYLILKLRILKTPDSSQNTSTCT